MNTIDLRDLAGEELAKWQKAFEEAGVDFEGQKENDPTMIPDEDFEDYAQELAEDTGMISRETQWPLTCIDWEQASRELKMDYSSVEVDGTEYWFRSY